MTGLFRFHVFSFQLFVSTVFISIAACTRKQHLRLVPVLRVVGTLTATSRYPAWQESPLANELLKAARGAPRGVSLFRIE
jgi:hypothetical protein